MKIKPVKLELPFGHLDAESKSHRKVEIGTLIKAEQYFYLEMFLGLVYGNSSTALNAQLLSLAITKFGTLQTPVSTSFILHLDKTDFDELTDALNSFTEQNGTPTYLDEKTVKLAHGLTIDDISYDLVEFGNRTTGLDKVEAERMSLTGTREMAYLAGKKVARLRQSNGAAVLEGRLGLASISELYLADLIGVIQQGKIWEENFKILG